jgi:predicted PurR-regulated permease PerM
MDTSIVLEKVNDVVQEVGNFANTYPTATIGIIIVVIVLAYLLTHKSKPRQVAQQVRQPRQIIINIPRED